MTGEYLDLGGSVNRSEPIIWDLKTVSGAEIWKNISHGNPIGPSPFVSWRPSRVGGVRRIPGLGRILPPAQPAKQIRNGNPSRTSRFRDDAGQAIAFDGSGRILAAGFRF